jgi:hypothetical protein
MSTPLVRRLMKMEEVHKTRNGGIRRMSDAELQEKVLAVMETFAPDIRQWPPEKQSQYESDLHKRLREEFGFNR